MSADRPVLHMLCGKIASGKSTLAARLASAPGTVLLAEDEWLAALYGDEMTTVADFVRCSARLRGAMGPHVATLLQSGLSVVLDFQANTVASRAWMRSILEGADADHRLHVLSASDEACLARLRARNIAGEHAFAATEAEFRQVAKHYVEPVPEEGFEIVLHRDTAAGARPGD